MQEEFEAVIGLEIHAQLLVKSKIFCSCSVKFGSDPNTQTCPVCLGMPGVLPVLNKKAVEFAIKIGLATHCAIAPYSKFARKNYFYPDLPKGYQISQYDQPVCENGWVEIEVDGSQKRIGLTRIHLEEDAGKSIHDESFVEKDTTLIDLNRCGTPLIEIVSEPDFRSPVEVSAYLTDLRQLVQYLNICDGNMEEGSLRCDANVSIRVKGQKKLGTKTELKNMNSIKNVERALHFEINRQVEILKRGEKVLQATLLWDADLGEAKIMRTKEEAHDYRYFPDPDLVPVVIPKDWIEEIKKDLPEFPKVKRERFVKDYNLPEYDATILTSSLYLANYFENVLIEINDSKLVSNWVMGEVLRFLKDKKMEIKDFPIPEKKLGKLLLFVKDNIISGNAAKTVFEEMLSSSEEPLNIIERLGLKQVSDEVSIEALIDQIIKDHPDEVGKYREGKKNLIGFFVGQVMKASKGKANPKVVNQLLNKKLKTLEK